MENQKVVAAILCGGRAKRLAPATTLTPKQFLNLLPEKTCLTMLQDTVARVANMGDTMIITSADQAGLARAQATGSTVIVEPEGRNTCCAIALGAFQMDQDAVMIVLPSDHWFGNVRGLQACLDYAVEVASKDKKIIQIGIKPTRPHTGYGHIECGRTLQERNGLEMDVAVYEVLSFKEKPDLRTAEEFMASGRYMWNAGIFVFRVSTFLRCLEAFQPVIYRAFVEMRNEGFQAEFVKETYRKLPNISVDYLIMQPAAALNLVSVIVLSRHDLGWSDIGGYNALADVWGRDRHGNACNEKVTLVDCEGVIGYTDGLPVTVLEQKDLIVSCAGRRVLVCPVAYEQQVGDFVPIFDRYNDAVVNIAPGVNVEVRPEGITVDSAQ